MKLITAKISIEELISFKPEAISYLMDKGVKCVRCGEPVWGSLEDSAKEKGFSDEEIEEIVREINTL